MKKKKITRALLGFAIAFSMMLQRPVCAAAEETQSTESTESADAGTTGSAISTNDIAGWPTGPDIASEAAVVMEEGTNTILYAKNMDETLYPGSTVKVMTCLLALENSQLSDVVTMTDTGVSGVTDGGVSISSQLDENFTMEQCLYAIMVASANDIALQVAEQVGGSVENFVTMMNSRAAELGCTGTVFTNPTGLPDDSQHTTAHDMALIMEAAISNEEFLPIAQATSYTIPATNVSGGERVLTSKFAMTNPSETDYYEGCIGGKEGYTNASGSTLVCAAQKNDMTLICVVLNGASGETEGEAGTLLDYGFDNFETMTLGQDDFSLISGGDVVVPAGASEEDLTVQDTQNGEQIDRAYLFGGAQVGTAVLEAAEDDTADAAAIAQGQQNLEAARNYSEQHSVVPYIVIGAVAFVLLLLLLMRMVKIVKS